MIETLSEVQELIDKQAVMEVLLRYCRGVDRLDQDLIESAFHSDAIDDHGIFVAHGTNIAREIIRRTRKTGWSSMHHITNVLVDVVGDAACSEAYFMSFALMNRRGHEMVRTLAGRYLDMFARRGGEWRIAKRLVIREWSSVEPITESWAAGNMMLTGVRSRMDAVYALRDSLGL